MCKCDTINVNVIQQLQKQSLQSGLTDKAKADNAGTEKILK